MTNAPGFVNWEEVNGLAAAGAADRAARIAAGKRLADDFRTDLAVGRFDRISAVQTPSFGAWATQQGERVIDYGADEVHALLGHIVHRMTSSTATRTSVGKANGKSRRVEEAKAHNAALWTRYCAAARSGEVVTHTVMTPPDLDRLRDRAHIRIMYKRARRKAQREQAKQEQQQDVPMLH